MKFKSTYLLLGLFVALFAYVYYFEYLGKQKREEEEAQAKKVFPVHQDSIQTIDLTRNGEQYSFKRENRTWWITQPVDYKGDRAALDRLARAVDMAETQRIVDSTGTNAQEYGINEPSLILTFTASGMEEYTLRLGKKSPTGNAVFAQKSGNPAIFLVGRSMLSDADKELFDFRDKKVLDFSKFDVRKMTVKNVDGAFTLRKENVDDWYVEEPVNAKADKAEVDRILDGVLEAKIKMFHTDEPESLQPYQLDKPAIELGVLLGENESEKALIIGKKITKTEDAGLAGQSYAKDRAKQTVFSVDSVLVTKLSTTLYKLRDKDVTAFERDSVNTIMIDYGDSVFVCVKDTARNWRITEPQDAKAKNWKINGILSDIRNLQAEKFLEYKESVLKNWQVSPPIVSVLFKQDDTEILRVGIGKQVGENRYFLNATDQQVFEVRESVIEDVTFSMDEMIDLKVEEEDDKDKAE